MNRLIAVLMLLIPGVLSAYGIKLMRDTLFNDFHPIFFHIGIQFVAGFLFFLIGISFIGGFIVYRDRKKQSEKRKNMDQDK
ncbi:DUF2627 domain-containing protein [Lentibacillus salinarum]|uniref:DUF2627 domain-containing protein n=1 Tax=Lentibacillus salinarum TaxID=446820 RepID=A0ABW3ZRJ5_9BACI